MRKFPGMIQHAGEILRPTPCKRRMDPNFVAGEKFKIQNEKKLHPEAFF